MELVNPLSKTTYPAQTVSYTGTAGTSTPWSAGAEGVWVWSDQACYVQVGDSATTATTGSLPVPANFPVKIKVPLILNGAPFAVSAIQVSTGGTLYAKPINRQ